MSNKQKTKRIRVQFDLEYKGDVGKQMNQDGDTVPDMSLTIRQLLQNHSRGQQGQVVEHEPLYFETEIPTIYDITDVAKYRSQLEDRLKEVKNFIKNEQKEAEAEKAAQESETKTVDDDIEKSK